MDKTTKLIRWQRITIASLILLLTVLSCHYYLYRQNKIGINFDNPPPVGETEESALFTGQEFVRGAFLGSTEPQNHPEIVFGSCEVILSPPLDSFNHRDSTQPWKVGGKIYPDIKEAKPLSWRVCETWDEGQKCWRLESLHVDVPEQ